MRIAGRSRKVVIIAQAARSIEHPADHEVWVINGPRFPPRWDLLFQLHGLQHIVDRHGPEYLGLLADYAKSGFKRVVMTHQHWPGVEGYPLAEVNRNGGGELLTNSIPLAIEYAILKGVTRIALDGMQYGPPTGMWGDGEGWAVPAILYHLGRASGMGIEIEVPPATGIPFGRYTYGFEGPGSV